MSDQGMYADTNYDPYGMDPETEALIQALAGTGYQPYPQMLNVPYTKELLGVGTDPLRNLGGAQTRYKSAASIMGYDPVKSFAGPEFDPYVSQYDPVAQEVQGDQYGEALLQDLESGKGALALATEIDNATYDPKTGPSQDEGKVLSPAQAKNYKDWLSRAQKAYTVDQVETQKRQQQATLGDPYAEVQTPEAQQFNVDDWISRIAARGDLGPQRQQVAGHEANGGGTDGKVFASSFTTPTGKTPVALRGKTPPPGAQVVKPGSNALSRMFENNRNAGYAQREQAYRNEAGRAVQNAVQPSPARERAVRAVMAYRLAMGLPST